MTFLLKSAAASVTLTDPRPRVTPRSQPGGSCSHRRITMRAMLAVVSSIALAVMSWGSYIPVLHMGQEAMGRDRLRPFICVGLAYFVIAVVAPMIVLLTRGEKGGWSRK